MAGGLRGGWEGFGGRASGVTGGWGRGGGESEGDALEPPPGPPPGFELIIPEIPKVEAVGGEGDADDDEPLPPPPMPPPEDEECDDDEALPPPPTAPPEAEETTAAARHAPHGVMWRPPPPQRRPPPPQRRPPPRREGGFFSAPRAPVDPSAFTNSAAPTATPMVRAEQNVALKRLVPASVRVKRQEAPEGKRQRVATGNAINSAPNVEDKKYLSFLDEMAELGAFAE